MYEKTVVEVPDDTGVHIKSAGRKNEKYVYKHIKYFRNEKGKPRNNSKLIGKLDNDTGKMYPNKNYYELYNVDITFPDITIWDYGYSYLILHVCHSMGLYECLSASCGIHTMEIIIMAAYIIREGNAMDGIDDWQQRNYFNEYNKLRTSQSCSRSFVNITAKQRYSFFKKWITKSFTGGSVCYDVTSISSYSQGMTEVEHGYNRDNENLCQFNLGMFCDEASKTPLYYSRYNGSLTDKTNLSYVLADFKDLGISRVKMILDGGFWSEECIKTLEGYCDAFTIGMPIHLKESEKILDTHADNIECYANELKYRHIYCVQAFLEIHSVAGRVLVFYDALNHLKLCEEMSDRIEMLSSELAKLKRYHKGKVKRYEPYFKVTKHDLDSGFDYVVDTDKVEKLRRSKGFFLLFSTDMTSTPSDILYYYRAKDADEKLFAQIKVDMECDRFRTHKQETTDGNL
jgi:transposase